MPPIDALIARLYQQALETDLGQDILGLLQQLFNCERLAIVTTSRKTQSIVELRSVNISESMVTDYAERYFCFNFKVSFVEQPQAVPGFRISFPGAIGESEMVQTIYYKEFLQKYDIHFSDGLVLDKDDHTSTSLWLMSGRGTSATTPHRLDRLSALTPHLCGALRIARAMAAKEKRATLLSEGLDALPTGIFIVDADLRIQHMNEAARRLVAARDGLEVTRDEVLRIMPGDQQKRIAEWIGRPQRDRPAAPAAILVERPSQGRPYFAHLQSGGQDADGTGRDEGAGVVIVSDPDRSSSNLPHCLRETYRLTMTEARIACLLLDGRTGDQVVSALGISRNTLKHHLKSLFDKTGCRSQIELVAVLGKQCWSTH